MLPRSIMFNVVFCQVFLLCTSTFSLYFYFTSASSSNNRAPSSLASPPLFDVTLRDDKVLSSEPDIKPLICSFHYKIQLEHSPFTKRIEKIILFVNKQYPRKSKKSPSPASGLLKNPSPLRIDHRPSFRRMPESIAGRNGNTPAFHLPLIGGNQSENKKQRQNTWIPACAGMTNEGKKQSLPHWSRQTLVLHGRRIGLTLSSRRRSNATEKGAFVSKGPV